MSAGSGFTIAAHNVLNQENGVFFYSLNGRQAVPFGGAKLCVASPKVRMPMQNAGGSASGIDCTGSYSVDFNVWIAAGSDPALLAGATVDGQ